MKFEYDGDNNEKECVAYIDGQGDVVFKVGNTHNDIKTVCIEKNGFFHFNLSWLPENSIRKFYKGDKITITF